MAQGEITQFVHLLEGYAAFLCGEQHISIFSIIYHHDSLENLVVTFYKVHKTEVNRTVLVVLKLRKYAYCQSYASETFIGMYTS